MSHTTPKRSTRRARKIVPVPGVTPHPRGGWRVDASVGPRTDRRRAVRVHRDESVEPFVEHAQAVALLDSLREQLERELAGTSSGSLADLMHRFADDRARLGRAESYVRELHRKGDELAEHELGQARADQVSAGDLDAFYGELARAGAGRSTQSAWHKAISGALGAATRWGELAENVARAATPATAPPSTGAAPEPELARAYLDAVDATSPTLGSLLRVGALTGCRRGELCAFRWLDLDVERRELTVDAERGNLTSPKGSRWVAGPPKSRKGRRVALGDEALAELIAHRARRELLCELAGVELDPAGFIFGRDEWPDGSVPFRPDYVTRRSREIATSADLPVSVCHPHGLRHYYATQGIAAGADVASMAEQLGHDASVLLDTYAHAVDARRHAGAAAVGKTLAR